MSRLKDLYNNEIVEAMVKKFGYANVMEVPKLNKIVINMGVGEAVEHSELIHIVPHMLQIRMENMGPILVHMDALNVLRIHVSANLGSFVNNQHALSSLPCFVSKNCAKETGTDDKIIIMLHRVSP